MGKMIEVLNGDDRPHALRTLKRAVQGASGAARTHLASVLRSLNPDAARSRAFKGASSMKKTTKKAARRKGHRKHNPTPSTGTYTLRSVGTKAKAKVAAVSRKAVSNFQGMDLMGILKEGAGVGVGMLASSLLEKQAGKFLPASLPPIAKSALASAVVAGGAIAFGGSKGFTRSIAVGAIGEAIRSIGRNYAPSLFAGTDGDGLSGVEGYWDENGQWVEGTPGLSGVIYDPAFSIPAAEERPSGM